MLVSRKILNKYVDLSGISDETIAHTLTFAGIEVEDFYPLAVGTHLVIGQITSVDKVAGSDHLNCLQVDLGNQYGHHQIICGAPNVFKQAKVIVAREGAVLKDLTIKKTTIHGFESNGMCCSLLELGVDASLLDEEDIAGIAILRQDAPVGEEDVLAFLDLDDTIFDVRPLANRSDVLAIYNLARELGALFERAVMIPEFDGVADRQAVSTVATKTDKCPQFAIKEMYGLKVGPSPKWLVNALRSLGQRSINNIVDIGNYVMLLTGQPLHMYDIDQLPSLNFSVRDDLNETFVGLDHKTYQLETGDLIVMVDDRPVGIAGILGGEDSAISEKTVNVAIESAYFDRASIRQTATRLNLASEASQRFAKGINPHQTEQVINLAASLITSLCDAEQQSQIINDDHLNHNQTIIELSLGYINGLLGTDFSLETVINVLERLGMKVTERNEKLYVVVPPHRIDISAKADLSEEIIRLLGFYNVNSVLPTLPSDAGGYSQSQKTTNLVRHLLQSQGLYETLTYTLVSEEETRLFRYLNREPLIALAHPMTPEHEFLRLNLLPSLLNVAQYNYARQQNHFGLFETSEVYSQNGQHKHLAALFVGERYIQGMLVKRPYDFYDAKGLVEAIMSLLDIKTSRYSIERLDHNYGEFHPGRSARLMMGKTLVGVFGELHPTLLSERDFNKSHVVALELDLGLLFDVKTNDTKMTSIPSYPSVTRDLALVVDEDIGVKTISDEIRKTDRKIIKDVQVFDIYRGEHLSEGTKSVALKITYQDEHKTLSDADVKILEEKIRHTLERKFSVTLRA